MNNQNWKEQFIKEFASPIHETKYLNDEFTCEEVFPFIESLLSSHQAEIEKEWAESLKELRCRSTSCHLEQAIFPLRILCDLHGVNKVKNGYCSQCDKHHDHE